MTKRERVGLVLRHRETDRLPTQCNFTGRMKKKIAAHFALNEAAVDERFDNHLLRVDLTFPKAEMKGSASETSREEQVRDWWGVGFDPSEEGYRIKQYPLAEDIDPASYSWPDPDAPGLLREAEERIAENDAAEDPRFVLPNFGFALFERAWSLRGLETFLTDLILEPARCEELLERITRIQVGLARRFVAAGVDGGYFGDDLGAQKGLLFGPGIWRTLFKPRLRRMFAVFEEAGLPVIMHSDGDIREIIPDLIEIGLTALNPCQPEVLDHGWLKREYGEDLAFYGGLSTQEVLPRGSRDDVERAARRCIDILASDGTGLIFGPSHRMMSDIPMDNVEALLDAVSYCTLKRE